METVGMVGLGNMGSALLERLRIAHVEPVVYDVDPAALAQARAAGAEPAASAAEVARGATLVDVVVRTDDEVLDCTLGEGGVLAGARPGCLLILHSTILPQTTRRVAEAASRREVHVIDACMLGVPDTVRRGELIFVVGGPEELVERARSHLLCMAREVRHVGPLGTGNVAKLVRNLTSGAETLLLHEAIRLAEAGGIPYVQALELLRETQGSSVVHRWQRTFDPSGVDPTPSIGHNVIGKDIPLAGELARIYGMELPIIEQLAAAGLRLAQAPRERG
jgi:3-hydroxyisobutyrate dehydrogenase-like beta-hydroxyacid dehydrogenase